LNKPDGTWRKDIVTYGIPLGKLIMVKMTENSHLNLFEINSLTILTFFPEKSFGTAYDKL